MRTLEAASCSEIAEDSCEVVRARNRIARCPRTPGISGRVPSRSRCACSRLRPSWIPMNWTTPSYEELKMDAEIGSYQQDQQDDEPPFVESRERRGVGCCARTSWAPLPAVGCLSGTARVRTARSSARAILASARGPRTRSPSRRAIAGSWSTRRRTCCGRSSASSRCTRARHATRPSAPSRSPTGTSTTSSVFSRCASRSR